MKLITKASISGFRSIDDVSVSPIEDMTIFVGRNNSGKSNILRALNLFFTGEPEPFRPLDFDVDHHTDPKRKRKKRIRVDVSWDLSGFHLPPALSPQLGPLGEKFTLRKEWTLTPQRRPVVAYAARMDRPGNDFRPMEESLMDQILALVNFRYIPNRTIPTDELAERAGEVSKAMSKRIERTQGGEIAALLGEIRVVARSVLHRVDQDMTESTDGLEQVEAAVSRRISDLISFKGYRARSPLGTTVGDAAWGSGTQAYLMFLVLHAIDRDRSGYFGWRQGSIWAVEEPESSLHHDLAVRLAENFHKWSSGDDRVQILCTTHSEIFTMRTDVGFEVRLDDGKTKASSRPIPLLASDAARAGVTSWPQPLLAFPYQPVVIVEGYIDSMVLAHAAKITGVGARFVFLSPSQLDKATRDGAENVYAYLKHFGGLWKRRMPEAPLLVLFDWDMERENIVRQTRALFDPEGALRVSFMDPRFSSPVVTEQWKGIERFYTPEFLRAAEDDGIVTIGQDRGGHLTIQRANLQAAKGALAHRLCTSTRAEDMVFLRKILGDLDERVAALTAGYYQHVLPLGPN